MDEFYPQFRADERTTLSEFLEEHRGHALAALDGVADGDAAARLLPHTEMTIGGIVKHLAHMEDLWFTHKFAGRDYPPPWHGGDEEWVWKSSSADSVPEIAALYRAACERSRAVEAEHGGLDEVAARPSFGKGPVSLRWLYVQMIRETAQHCGHLDLLRDVLRRR
jgi:hypothetical protein